MAEGRRRLRIGIDTGGTFTDVVAVDEATGEVFTTKTPSVPEDPSLAVLEGLRKVLRLAGAPAGAVAAVSHGTTVATNALLEERFDELGAGDDRGVPPRPRDRAAERAPGLRELLLLGEAGADRAPPPRARGPRAADPSGRGPAGARRGGGRRGRALAPGAGDLGDRRELPPRLREPGARAADAGCARPRAPGGARLALLRGVAGVPGVRAHGDDPGRRLRQGPGRRLRRADPGPARRRARAPACRSR